MIVKAFIILNKQRYNISSSDNLTIFFSRSHTSQNSLHSIRTLFSEPPNGRLPLICHDTICEATRMSNTELRPFKMQDAILC